MKAILQNFKSGEFRVEELPVPDVPAGGVRVRNAASLVSAGTERAVIELARMNPLQKARERPDLVRKVLNRASQEGLLDTVRVVQNLVGSPIPLGYSCAGVVDEAGDEVADFAPGDRVACAGLGYANHAEVVSVPRNLTVGVPDGVELDEAAFVTVGAIAMHGVRRAGVSVGENVVVLGAGLVGQLAVQILAAGGCRVFAVDLEPDKVALAKRHGAVDGALASDDRLEEKVRSFSSGWGADAVVVAAATDSDEPIRTVPELCRDRGRVVVVGDVGMDVPRRPYYDKEVDLLLSRSYGPGRYDTDYEEKGQDYPIGYVRWTERRNMASFLDLIARGDVDVAPLVSHRHPIERAEEAYRLLTGEVDESYLGILLDYEVEDAAVTSTVRLRDPGDRAPGPERSGTVRFGVVGAGQFAQGILLPRLDDVEGAVIHGVATATGATARTVAERYGAAVCTSDYRELIADDEVDALLVATRHDLHAPVVTDALRAGKDVFVEKPLALDEEGLGEVLRAHRDAGGDGDSDPVLLVGFNRRFSPLAETLRDSSTGRRLNMVYRVNAGSVPSDHWVQDPEEGGGRIVGEVCHFVDLMQFLSGADPVEVFAWARERESPPPADPDNVSIQLRFSDGSLGTVIYDSDGDPKLPKERLEVFGGGAAVLDNWRKVECYRDGSRDTDRSWLGSEKGHRQELEAFVRACRDRRPPVSLRSLALTTAATFAVGASLRSGRPEPVRLPSDDA